MSDDGSGGATPTRRRRRAVDPEALARGLAAGDRAALGRAITLVESTAPRHRPLADRLLAEAGRLAEAAGRASHRVGITGLPGAGKSTFIERFGRARTAAGQRVAVLAVDPSSQLTGGSILGDKTRMQRLANDASAFVRPSPSAGTLGGVARRTRETIALCEAAGYDLVVVETVGVGQSEAVVSEMVDTMLVLLLAGAGDELQGIKRGLLELADVLCINKADGDGLARAEAARVELDSAMRLVRGRSAAWRAPVLAVSGLEGHGLDTLWQTLQDHRAELVRTGELGARRADQAVRGLWADVEARLLAAFRAHPDVASALPGMESDVRAGREPAGAAADRLLAAFGVGGGQSR